MKLQSPPSIDRRAKLYKSIIFQLIVTNEVIFGVIFSTCVVYTKTIIYLDVGESGGYLPARQIFSTIHHYHNE